MSKRYAPNWRCCECCRFMSYAEMENAVESVRYGSATDLEPPDPVYMHRRCWDALPDDRKALTAAVTWSGSPEIMELKASALTGRL